MPGKYPQGGKGRFISLFHLIRITDAGLNHDVTRRIIGCRSVFRDKGIIGAAAAHRYLSVVGFARENAEYLDPEPLGFVPVALVWPEQFIQAQIHSPIGPLIGRGNGFLLRRNEKRESQKKKNQKKYAHFFEPPFKKQNTLITHAIKVFH
jgi:hypothetical protein